MFGAWGLCYFCKIRKLTCFNLSHNWNTLMYSQHYISIKCMQGSSLYCNCIFITAKSSLLFPNIVTSFHCVGQCKESIQVGQSAIFWGERVLALQQSHAHIRRPLLCLDGSALFVSFSRHVPLARNPLNMENQLSLFKSSGRWHAGHSCADVWQETGINL
jgi:hypothetical protein